MKTKKEREEERSKIIKEKNMEIRLTNQKDAVQAKEFKEFKKRLNVERAEEQSIE